MRVAAVVDGVAAERHRPTHGRAGPQAGTVEVRVPRCGQLPRPAPAVAHLERRGRRADPTVDRNAFELAGLDPEGRELADHLVQVAQR